MAKFDFNYLVGKYVSVLIDVDKESNGCKESYIGLVESIYDDYIILKYDIFHTSKMIKSVIFNIKHIVSFWIYDEQQLHSLKQGKSLFPLKGRVERDRLERY